MCSKGPGLEARPFRFQKGNSPTSLGLRPTASYTNLVARRHRCAAGNASGSRILPATLRRGFSGVIMTLPKANHDSSQADNDRRINDEISPAERFAVGIGQCGYNQPHAKSQKAAENVFV